MTEPTASWLAAAGVLVAWALPAAAEKPEQVYQQLFGQEAKKVAATRQTADDAAFAGKLMTAAEALPDSPGLQVLLYRKACEFALKSPAGCEKALEALNRLIELDPAGRAAWQQQRLDVMGRLYRRTRGAQKKALAEDYLAALLQRARAAAAAGKPDEAAELYRRALPVARYLRSPETEAIAAAQRALAAKLAALRKLQVRLNSLKARLARDPNDAGLREQFILLHLLEADRPAAAAALLNGTVDESYRTYVPLAAKEPGDVPEAACIELAAWYAAIAPKAPRTGQVNALLRARAWYDRFLDVHTKRDTQRIKARLAADKVEKELRRLGADVIPRSEWMELIEYVDPARHATGGKWRRKDEVLVSDAEIFNRITIPVSPRGDYVLEVRFSRHRGGSDWQGFFVFFPVGDTQADFVIDFHKGTVAGLGNVKGKIVPSKASPYKRALLKIDRPHTVRVEVEHGPRRTARIVCRLDGRDVITWRGPWSALSPERKIQRRDCFGVGAFWSQVSLRSVKLYSPQGKPKVFK